MNLKKTPDWRKEPFLRYMRAVWRGATSRIAAVRLGKSPHTMHRLLALEPMAVEDACWRELKQGSKTWTLAVELPTSCVVHVSVTDWEAYWGVQAAEKSSLLGKELTERAIRSGADAGFALSVRVIPDATLSPGSIEVTTAFFDVEIDKDESAVAVTIEGTAPCDKLPVTEKLGSAESRTTGNPADDKEHTTTTGSIPKTERSPLGKLPCILVSRDENVLFGKDGDTIGADRDPHHMPQLAFSHDAYPHIHREHARLANKSGQWSIINLGYNGTQVLQSGETLAALDVDEECVLSEGDVIVLAGELVLEFHQGIGASR